MEHIKPLALQRTMSGRTSTTVMLMTQAAARYQLNTPKPITAAQAEAAHWKELIPAQAGTPEQLAIEAIKKGEHPADSEHFTKQALLAALDLNSIRMNIDRAGVQHVHDAHINAAPAWRAQVEKLLMTHLDTIKELIDRPAFARVNRLDQVHADAVPYAEADDMARMREATRHATDLAGIWWGLASLENAQVKPPLGIPFTTVTPQDFLDQRQKNLANYPSLDTAVAAGDFYLLAKHGSAFKLKTLDELAAWQTESAKIRQSTTYQRGIYLGDTTRKTGEATLALTELLNKQS